MKRQKRIEEIALKEFNMINIARVNSALQEADLEGGDWFECLELSIWLSHDLTQFNTIFYFLTFTFEQIL